MARDQMVPWASMSLGMQLPFKLKLPPTCLEAAEHAADQKCAKYSSLPATQEFVPVAVELLGPVNHTGCEFLMDLGHRVTAVSGDPLETVLLFQRLSMCTQRFNAVGLPFRGTSHNQPGTRTTNSRLMAHPRIVSKRGGLFQLRAKKE